MGEEAQPAHRRRSLVLLFDGTGQVIRTGSETNIGALLRAMDRSGGDQIVFYDPGVGAFIEASDESSSIRGFWRRLGGLALGAGVKENVRQGYRFLMAQWEPGTDVYMFGFSRGAYTARALAALTHMCGLLPRGSDHLLPMVFGVFWRNRVRWGDPDWAQAARIKAYLARPEPFTVRFLGVFDTVKTLGFWDAFLQWLVRGRLHRVLRDLTVSLPYSSSLPNVVEGRHAVALDEKRRLFALNEWEPEGPEDALREVWFVGVHSDVGGGYAERDLADISLRWMADAAQEAGLALDEDRLPSPDAENASGAIHESSKGFWRILGLKARTVPGGADLHPSVLVRCSTDSDYAPPLPADICSVEVDEPGLSGIQ